MLYDSAADGLTLRAVRKSFSLGKAQKLVLADIDLSVQSGEVVALVGASGCGKSTLLRIVAGLERDYAGTVMLGATRVDGPGPDRGLVFQEHRLFPWLNVEENIAFGLAQQPTAARAASVRALIELVGLRGFEHAYPHQLSGGMAQRAALARALGPRPRVLLLDEPFGALDAMTKIHMQDELARIWAAERTTLLLVTHDVDEAVFLADRVVVLGENPGHIRRIIAIDEPRPRERTSDRFAALRRSVFHELFASRPKPAALLTKERTA